MFKQIPFILVLVLGIFMMSKPVQAQDAVFSQFFAAPLLLNPAFAGTTRAPHISINHRSQNTGFNSAIAYQTSAIAYSQFVKPLQSGFGVSLFTDNAGDGTLRSNRVAGYYSYEVRIDENQSLRAGLSAALMQRTIDWDRLVFFDQIDILTGAGGTTQEQRPSDNSVVFADFSAGLLYSSKFAYGGISLEHLNTPDDRIADIGPGGFYDGYPMRITMHAGAQINFQNRNRKATRFITPNVLYSSQGPFEQLNVGAYLGYDKVFGGAWFRHSFGNSDAAIAVFGVEWDMYKLGYSYDFTVSGLSTASSGTHELSLQLNFDKAYWVKRKRKAERYNDCLQLFR